MVPKFPRYRSRRGIRPSSRGRWSLFENSPTSHGYYTPFQRHKMHHPHDPAHDNLAPTSRRPRGKGIILRHWLQEGPHVSTRLSRFRADLPHALLTHLRRQPALLPSRGRNEGETPNRPRTIRNLGRISQRS